jgi:hypothetical protein
MQNVICWNAQGFLDVWVVVVDILIVALKKEKKRVYLLVTAVYCFLVLIHVTYWCYHSTAIISVVLET